MGERISSCQILKTERVGEKALGILDRTYGEGYPTWKPGRQELSYHNGHHGRAVGEAALRLCMDMGLSSLESTIAQTAGYAHDLVQLKGRGRDESESAQWLEHELGKSDIPKSMTRMGALAILGTEPLFRNNQLVGQKATQLSYPDKTTEIVAKSVASADLGELYTPQGPYLSHQLFREIKGMPNESDIPFEEMMAFQRNQVGLTERYHYPLKSAEKLLATHRPQVTRYAHKTLRELESGTIETWDELLQKDEAFMRQYN